MFIPRNLNLQDALGLNALNQQKTMQRLLHLQQQSQAAAAELQPAWTNPSAMLMDGYNFSSGAGALMLLRTMSQAFDFMMNGANHGLPQTPDFGDRWGSDPFFNPTGQPQYQQPEPVQTTTPEARLTSPKVSSETGAKVQPLRQSNAVSCGQTSVAMCVNSVTGKKLTDKEIHRKYGFGLLHALNAESRSSGVKWTDGGNFSAKNWPSLEKRLNKEKTPVMIGLNGQFSPTGRGHIVTLLSIQGDKVTYADPANGKIKTTTKKAIEQAPPHPDGKFFFYASKT